SSDSGQGVDGYNVPGVYGHFPFFDTLYVDWVGDPNFAGESLQQLVDDYTGTLSHETIEQMVGPTGPGLQLPLLFGLKLDLGTAVSVSHGANYPDEGLGERQIADLEAQKYSYRLNDGVEVQSYWSVKDNAFIVADGNTQRFLVKSQYHDADG